MYSAFSRSTPRQPNEAEALALIQHSEKAELQQLLDDDSKIEALVKDLGQVRSKKRKYNKRYQLKYIKTNEWVKDVKVKSIC